MEFNTKKVQAMGKAIAEEIKRCGFSSDNTLYDVENAMRELQRQIGLAGMAELLEDRMQLIARMDARKRLRESEKELSKNIYERGVDNRGFGRIRSKGDAALFGGYPTRVMKERFGITKSRPLADFLPTLTIAAKNLATEMTNHNVQGEDL